MSDSELQIKITGNSDAFSSVLDGVKKQADDLESSLGTVALVSGAAWAALTATVVVSLEAFADSDAASRQLSNSLQNQGIYTDDLKQSYLDYADAVSDATGIDQAQLVAAQATAQNYLGQIPVTQKLTQAIADLSVAQGIDLKSAATEVGKAIAGGTSQLTRQGLQLSSTATEAQKYAQVLDFVTLKYGGAAEAANQGLGSVKGLENAFKEAEVELGERFAPAVTAIIEALTYLIKPAKDSSGEMANFKAALLVAGLVITGLIVGLAALALGFTAAEVALAPLIATLAALEITAGPLILIGVAVAALVVGIVELGLHWKQVTATIVAVTQDMASFFAQTFSGIKNLLLGAFHLDTAKLKEGLAEIGNALTGVKDAAVKGWQGANDATKNGMTTQDALKKQFADKAAAQKAADDANKQALEKAQESLTLAQLQGASKELIALKKAEVQTLTQITKSKNATEKALLVQELAEERALEADQIVDDKQKLQAYAQIELTAQADLANKKITADTKLTKQEKSNLTSTILTKKDVQKKAYSDELTSEIKAHNTFLEEENKYGTAYATINKALHDSTLASTNSAFSDLAQLTQSKNDELKAIGKVAAVANIVIKTASSAMNIYEGFSAIPIIGPVLGVVGAAAAVAFGAEQIGNVTSAATGGIVGGSGYGDTQPYMLEPGELVTPRKNFDEVVNSVAAQRNQNQNPGTSGAQNVGVTVGFDGRDAQQVLTARTIQAAALGTLRQR